MTRFLTACNDHPDVQPILDDEREHSGRGCRGQAGELDWRKQYCPLFGPLEYIWPGRGSPVGACLEPERDPLAIGGPLGYQPHRHGRSRLRARRYLALR